MTEWEEGEVSVCGGGKAENREQSVVIGQQITVFLEMVPRERPCEGYGGVRNRCGGNTRHESLKGKREGGERESVLDKLEFGVGAHNHMVFELY